MKLILIIFSFVIWSSSMAAETTTDCPMMKEKNLRDNPKANLPNSKPKPVVKGASQQ